MTNFITAHGVAATSEEQMYPILQSAAEDLGTPIRSVGWLEAGLIAPDILQRFPYEEHPFNIALVLSMADELGIARDFALKEMADRVVPDLGVLKTYPTALCQTRQLEFVNGMSANERFGCLGNWTRMGFDAHDPLTAPGVWISTVVNNRADRVPRSRVFASILVADIRADRHFIIGNNLTGLMGYIQEAWQRYAQELTLWPTTGETPLEVLQRMAQHMHVATQEDQVIDRLRAMLQPLTIDPDTLLTAWRAPETLNQDLQASGLETYSERILDHLRGECEAYDAYRQFAERLDREAASENAKLDEDFRALLWAWFQRKLVVIDDYHATGNQVIERICHETPPGYLNRIMGLQNIKGTGLGFVYCWQAWEECHRAGLQLRSQNPQAAAEGLRVLSSFHDYNLLCVTYVRETLDIMREELVAQNENFQASLAIIAANLETSIQKMSTGVQTVHRSGIFTHVAGMIEAFLDAGDAVRRRKKANKISPLRKGTSSRSILTKTHMIMGIKSPLNMPIDGGSLHQKVAYLLDFGQKGDLSATEHKIYKDLTHERISQARAVSELQALTSRQKGGWLLKKLKAIQAKRTAGPVS